MNFLYLLDLSADAQSAARQQATAADAKTRTRPEVLVISLCGCKRLIHPYNECFDSLEPVRHAHACVFDRSNMGFSVLLGLLHVCFFATHLHLVPCCLPACHL